MTPSAPSTDLALGRRGLSRPAGAQRRALLLLALAWAPLIQLQGQDPPPSGLRPDLPVDQYEHRKWSMDDGLPSEKVHDIAQTPDGYLWLATERGLARFDGLHFTVFNRTNTPEFSTNQIIALCAASDGSLWIGTMRSGLFRYRSRPDPEFEFFADLEGLKIHCLYESRDGTLWIGTELGTWTVADGIATLQPEAPINVRAILEDEQGALWLGASLWTASRPPLAKADTPEPIPGAFLRDGEAFHRLGEDEGYPQTSPESSILSMCPDRRGGFWIGTVGRELLHYRDGSIQSHRDRFDTDASWFHTLLQDRADQLWIGTATKGFYRLTEGAATKVPIGISPVRCLAEDRDGNLWFGGVERGLGNLRNPDFVTVPLAVPGAMMRCVSAAPDGSLWFGSGNPQTKYAGQSGLHQFKDGAFRNIGPDHGLPTHTISAVVAGSEGRVWAGLYRRGLLRWTDDDGLSVFTTDDGLLSDWIKRIHEDRHGALWLGTWEGGLQRFEGGTFTTLDAFGDADVSWFHEDDDGLLWIGSNRGLWQIRSGEPVQLSDPVLDALPTSSFSSFWKSEDGTLWLGTQGGGLCRLRDGKFSNWSSEQGLHDDVINLVALDAQDRLWLGGPHGLSFLPRTSLDEVDNGTLDRLQPLERLPRTGGGRIAIGSEFYPHAVRRDDGSVWILTRSSALVIPAGDHQSPTPPIVHIESLSIDGDRRTGGSPVEIVSGTKHLDLHFAAVSFAAPERVRYRYRLQGYDREWIAAGTARQATYTDLAPGDYVFEVAADNGYGTWADETASLAIAVTPRWWERRWIQAAAFLVLALGLVVYVRHRLRTMQRANAALRREIEERQRAEEESRTRFDQLARVSRAATMGELTSSIAHEVKQPLFAIVSNAQTAKRLLDPAEPDIEEIRETLQDIADDGNRASSIIDHVRSLVKKEHKPSEQLDLNEVARAAVNLLQPEIRKRRVLLTTELAEDLPKVKGDPIELQQVILNFLVNGTQALSDNGPEARVLNLRTTTGRDSVELAVEDRGIGVDNDDLDELFEPFYTTKEEGTGMGLSINRTIIDAHGGRIWATRNDEAGMTFHFSLPA